MVSQEMLTIKLYHHPFQFTDHQLNRSTEPEEAGPGSRAWTDPACEKADFSARISMS